MSADTITRVLDVELENFRGFKTFGHAQRPHAIETDADLVLISGPNGCGKTSLLEALLLLLTGWYDADADAGTHGAQALVSLRPEKNGQKGAPAERFHIKARVKREDGETADESTAIEAQWKSAATDIVSVPTGLPDSRLLGDAKDTLHARELDARLTGFFQGRIDRLFDQAARGSTFRDVFDPLPPPVRVLGDMWDDLRQMVERTREETAFKEVLDPPASARRERLRDEWQALLPPLRDLARHLSWSVTVADAMADEESLDPFARELTKESGAGEPLRNALRQLIRDGLDTAVRQAESTAKEGDKERARIEEQLTEVRQKLAELRDQYPDLDRELASFAAADELPDALATFRTLERHAERWARVEIHEKLRRVREELAKVSAADAGKCAGMLEDFLRPRRETRRQLDDLERDERRLEEERRRAVTSERLRALRDIDGKIHRPLNALLDAWAACHEARDHEERKAARERARMSLEAIEQAISACQQKIEELIKPSEEIMAYLQERAQAVMGRYSMVDGCLPLRLEPVEQDGKRSYHVLLGDGRKLEHLSSGQRAQVALAMLVGQNQGAAHLMAHRVILLDDITTDYDLSNLSRQAILVRQLAYGATDSADRRQVFVSSHHEDMTNQILDLLAPPAGRSMRFIRFTGWSNVTGPQYEVLEVVPSGQVDEKALGRGLGEF
jgi:energy-coupling factor transporter ATP-binding protein EcfA2